MNKIPIRLVKMTYNGRTPYTKNQSGQKLRKIFNITKRLS